MAVEKKPYIVFGYGSLIFKPPPHTISQVPGYLKGYVRRFAQRSPDHRGTVENPGRVVTLIHKEDRDEFSGADPFPDDDVVWGLAYTIDPEFEDEVREYLDFREKNGYTVEILNVYTSDAGKEKVAVHGATVYVALKSNPSFTGSESLPFLANHIWKSVGPSGPNKDYLYGLATGIRQLAPGSHDSHLFALETLCRELDAAAVADPATWGLDE